MKQSYVLNSEDFDGLLALLSPDRDEAAVKFERIRAGLVRFFEFKGCSDPESLADETFNRVASRISTFDPSKNVRPVTFIYGFASKIMLEHRRRLKTFVPLDAEQLKRQAPFLKERHDEPDPATECLEKCLGRLEDRDRELVIEYYSRERQEKIELRRQIAEKLNCSPEVLYTRVFRLRGSLKSCIGRCLNGAA